MKAKELLQSVLGEPLEKKLNELTDEHLTVDKIGEQLEKQIVKRVGKSNEPLVQSLVEAGKEAVGELVELWRKALKHNIIDKIDGEDDLPDIDLGKKKSEKAKK